VALSVNQHTIVGNLGADPEMHFSQEGKAICRLRVAVQGFKRDDPPTWFSVTAFGKDAEFVGQYLHKGDTVYVQGTGELRKATDKSGVEKEYYGIAARTVQGVNAKAKEGVAAGNVSADDIPFALPVSRIDRDAFNETTWATRV
jgi:single-strand DNA-binding protein